jgi:hypothetical protein
MQFDEKTLENTAIHLFLRVLCVLDDENFGSSYKSISCHDGSYCLDGLLYFLIDAGFYETPIYNRITDMQRYLNNLENYFSSGVQS